MSNYMDVQEQYFSQFQSLVAHWVKAYNHADYAYVGVKTTGGARLIAGRIFLNPFSNPQMVAPFAYDSEHVIAGRFVLDISEQDVLTMLESLRCGEMLGVGGTVVSLQPDNSLNTICSPVRHPFVADGIRVPNIKSSGISRQTLLSGIEPLFDIDWELKSGQAPFDSLDDLLRHCALPIQSEMGGATWLEIVAGCPAFITDKSVIDNGEARIECRVASSLDAEALRVGYKIFQGEGNIERRESLSGTSFEWRLENGAKEGSCRVQVGDAQLMQAFASYSGVALHQWWITDPNKRLNPRHAIHQVFDDDLELLTKQLFKPESDKAHMFEQAVSTLLNLIGFSTGTYGRIPKLQRGPDVIAISPAGNIGVVECTLGLINENDKLAKLVQRTKLIKDKLSQTGYGHLQVLPVVVTPLPRTENSANLEEAGKLGIAVVCKEDIEALIVQVRLSLNPEKWFEDAKSLVPRAMGFASI